MRGRMTADGKKETSINLLENLKTVVVSEELC